MATKKTIYIKHINDLGIDWCIVHKFDKRPKSNLRLDYTPQEGDKLYIYPGASIPRFKMKGFCETHKVSMVKKKESANVLFANWGKRDWDNEDYYECDSRMYSMNKKDFLKFVEPASVSIFNDADLKNQILKIIKAIEDSENDEIIFTGHVHWNLVNRGIGKNLKLNSFIYDIDEDGNIENTDEKPKPKDYILKWGPMYFANEQQISNYNALTSKNAYHQDALLSILNCDNATIDKEMYEGMCNIFESGDRTNYKIAMEAMANCNYDASAIYLMILFEKYNYQMNDCSEKNHVNFKSLQKYFNINVSRRIDFDDVVTILINKKLVNKSNISILMEEAYKHIEKSNPLDHFDVATIKIKDERLLELLKEETIVEEQV